MFDSQLKLALKRIEPYSLGHKFPKFAFQQSLNYFAVMFTILLQRSKYCFLHNEHKK
jgi:hypothetical protein